MKGEGMVTVLIVVVISIVGYMIYKYYSSKANASVGQPNTNTKPKDGTPCVVGTTALPGTYYDGVCLGHVYA